MKAKRNPMIDTAHTACSLRSLMTACVSLCLLTFTMVTADTPDFSNGALSGISVYPNQIAIDSGRDEIQIVVTGRYGNGVLRDLSLLANLEISDPGIAALDHTRVVPRCVGNCSLIVSFENHQVTVPVAVSSVDEAPISFRFESLAVITKQGCNAGSCHGSPQGKGGFSLSLFAYDPDTDKISLVRGGLARRINTLSPNQSLLLKKPMLRVSHVGGKKLRKTDVAYHVLRQWIAEGAVVDTNSPVKCDQIIITPTSSRVIYFPDRQQQMNVTASFSDGTTKDVTQIASYDSTNKEVATVDASGLVTCHAKGQAAITIRYLEHFKSVYITHAVESSDFVWKEAISYNAIDSVINERLNLLQIQPSSLCNDAVFLRRVYLDLTGLLPSSEKTRAFLSDETSDKRARLIDRLLDSNQFAHFQAVRIADLLHVNERELGDHRARIFSDWIADAIKQSRPYDEFVRELLTAAGDSYQVPAANYFAAIPSTEEVSESTAQIFMGSRIRCAKCHNHPFENWTQDDYYSIGAVFHRLERKESIVNVLDSGEMNHPKTGQAMEPWGSQHDTPGEPRRQEHAQDRRIAFANWLTAKENPYFAHVQVNRIWSYLLGKGIVDPIDDFRSSNPPSNVKLIDLLAREFYQSNFDCKHIFRMICNSAAYQRCAETTPSNELDSDLFSHHKVRLLAAEQIQDAVAVVTGSLPAGDQIDRITEEFTQEWQQLVTELTARRGVWEAELRTFLKDAPFWHGDWWTINGFVAETHQESFETVFAPEKSVLEEQIAGNPSEEVFSLDHNVELDGRKWKLRRGYRNAQQIVFPEHPATSHYIYHRVFANTGIKTELFVKGRDCLGIWQNRTSIYSKLKIPNDGEALEVTLEKGWNHFLVKLTNAGGKCYVTLDLKPVHDTPPQTIRGDLALALMLDSAKLIDLHQHTVRDHLFYEAPQYVALTRKVTVGKRFDYATQRPYPEQSEFLKAFGQPERNSPCACDRLSAPTLEQAIRMLNGQYVFDRVATGLDRFQSKKNDELIEELYIAAYCRPPTNQERQNVMHYLSDAEDRQQAIKDVIWTVLVTEEFLFQH